MTKQNVYWEQTWRAFDGELRLLRCVQNANDMQYEVIDPQRQADANEVEVVFDLYQEAVDWLTEQQFVLDLQDAVHHQKTGRRFTPQEKKRLSYDRDHHSMSTGQGASRRVQSRLRKIRRRQYRRRLKAYLRRETQGLFRDVSEQSLRSIRPDDTPEYRRSVPLETALEEKRLKREAREQAKAEEDQNNDQRASSGDTQRLKRKS